MLPTITDSAAAIVVLRAFIFGHGKSGNIFQNLPGRLIFCIKLGNRLLFLETK